LKIRLFTLGFVGGVVLFGLLNLLAAHLRSDCGLPAVFGLSACADDIRRAGFPWLFWEEGGFAYRSNFYLTPFLADIALALIVSLLLGLGLQRWAARWPQRG
jgi:hypothetical protein